MEYALAGKKALSLPVHGVRELLGTMLSCEPQCCSRALFFTLFLALLSIAISMPMSSHEFLLCSRSSLQHVRMIASCFLVSLWPHDRDLGTNNHDHGREHGYMIAIVAP